ncbi:MAG TPA: wax ester/triacylglycerol synthase family O-acyltransferase [Myxococcota bacterium]|nr:wax ester/triacylglycerol synthase family O-acyltransferase [Myxococcota bacterium]
MGATIYEERMGDSDALTWTIERDPLLRSTILSVWRLDRMPDLDRLRAKIVTTARVVPRLRQRVAEDPLRMAPPRWEDDPWFDLAYHVRRAGAPGKGTLRDLLDFAEPIAMQGFDRDRPLWEFTLVEGLGGGQAAAILKIHHAMSDGVGLVRMTEGLIERSREAEPGEAELEELAAGPKAEPWSPIDETLDALRYQASRRLEQGRSAASAVVQGLSKLVRSPVSSLQNAAELAGSAGRLLAPASEPMSPIMTGRGMTRRLHTFSRPVEALKRAGKLVGGTVNDAFVAGVAGGLGRYHELHGRAVPELRMSMPINLRHGEKARKAGNQFAPVRFPIPVGIADPVERMREIRRRVASERAEPSLPALDVIAGALNRLPAGAATSAFGGMLKTVDFVTSNVPGPRFPVYVSGAKILAMIPFGPASGAATNVTLFSYDGEAHVGITSDAAAAPDADRLAECLAAGMDEVLAAAA